MLDLLVEILRTNLDGKVVDEAALMKVESVGKIYICIDEMISDVRYYYLYIIYAAIIVLNCSLWCY